MRFYLRLLCLAIPFFLRIIQIDIKTIVSISAATIAIRRELSGIPLSSTPGVGVGVGVEIGVWVGLGGGSDLGLSSGMGVDSSVDCVIAADTGTDSNASAGADVWASGYVMHRQANSVSACKLVATE